MITGIIMASGFSKRMERNKLTLKINEDFVIERVIKAAKESKLDDIILVYHHEKIREIGLKYGINTVYNSCPEKGQSESMKIGINASTSKTKAFMFMVGDQPLLDFQTINILIDHFNSSNSEIVVPIFNKKRGNPTIFSSKLKKELLKVEGDKGGRTIIEKNINQVKFVNIENTKAGLDIDTWDEYLRVKEMEMEK